MVIKDKKKFICVFLISFAVTALFICLMLFVVLRGMFFNIYCSKGDKKVESGNYQEAIKDYNTAKGWQKKNQKVYLKLANAYALMEDYDSAGDIIDEAIKKRITSDENGLEQLYTMRIKVYSTSGNLVEAVSYTDGLEDQYILKRIQAIRPADLSYTPNQGNYDKTLKMEITVREGETVYYTTDGTYPNKFSNTYVSPINIGNGTTHVTAISVNEEGLVSPLLSVTYNVTNENEAVSFDDPKIELMVRRALSKNTGVVRVKELASLTELSNDGIEGNVNTLSDLDLMPNLEVLLLDHEKNLVSISQLSGKTKLHTLSIAGCSLDSTDINVLGSLTALETLDLSDNSLTSISALSNLTTLKYLYIARNGISDLSALSALTSLEMLDASYNRLTEAPDLENGATIKSLCLGSNAISDISTMHRYTNLTYLDLSQNNIKSAKTLAELTALESLTLSSNSIANFDFLSSLKKLTYLDVSSTSFVNIKSVKDLNLTYFSANDTGLASISGLENMKELISLGISSTNVSDLSPIKGLDLLGSIDISYCNIKDLTPLSTLKGLYSVKANGVDLTGIEFVNKELAIID